MTQEEVAQRILKDLLNLQMAYFDDDANFNIITNTILTYQEFIYNTFKNKEKKDE